MREIVIWVPGYPPAKNAAKSMLAAGHVHADRVLALLRAASDKARSDDTPIYFSRESPGLELIVTGPGQPPSDAANYPGAVAGVLEDKQHRGDLLHLGELAGIALHGNDRQLHDVRYRRELGQDLCYQVRIWQR